MARKIECPTCGRRFTRVVGQVYCSPGCRPVELTPIRTCPTCGREFPRVRAQRYCSPGCRPSGPKPARRTCPTCGREFAAAQGRRYCSPPCRPSWPGETGRPRGRAKDWAKRRRLRDLLARGLTRAQAAAELGLSKQRIYQLLSD